jgi:PleD family two-component response regulator
LVYPAGDKAGLCQLAERIVLQCHQPMIDASGNEFVVSASVGVVAGCRGLALARLFQRADVAMYEAKHRGGNAYHFASD